MEFYVSLIPLVSGRKRRKRRCIHNGAKGRIVERGITTSLSDLCISNRTIAQNIESNDHLGSGTHSRHSAGLPFFCHSLHNQVGVSSEAVSKDAVRSNTHAA